MSSRSRPPVDPREGFLDRLLVLRGDRAAVTATYGSPGDPAHDVTCLNELWGNVDIIEEHRERLRHLERTELLDLGMRLGWVAFPPLVRDRLLEDLRLARRQGRRLRVWLRDSRSGLGDLPWEYLYIQEDGCGFLALHPCASIVRDCHTDEADARPACRTTLESGELLRILLVYADPDVPELAPLAAAPLLARIRHHLAHLRSPAEVYELLPSGQTDNPDRVASRAHLERDLRAIRPHIVLLIAHGVFDETQGEEVVFLERDASGAPDEVSGNDLARLVPVESGPAVMLLDTCWSFGLARALAVPGRAIIGMQFSWPAAADPLFWNTFFSSIVAPATIDDCLFEAREMVSRGSPGTPDWGCPVLVRRGIPGPRRAPVVEQPHWRSGLLLVRGRLAGRDRELVDEILSRLPAWQLQADLGALVRELDPLYVIVAGEEDSEHTPVYTRPLWWSRLMRPPSRFTWRATHAGPSWLTVWATGGDDLEHRELDGSDVQLAPDAVREWPRGVLIRWQVRGDSSRSKRLPALVRGIFEIATDDEAAQWRSRVRQSIAGGVHSPVGGARLLLDHRLHDALFDRCSRWLGRQVPAPLQFCVHRVLADAAADMQRQLSLRGLGHPEGLWAAALARRHVEAAYRAIAGAAARTEES